SRWAASCRRSRSRRRTTRAAGSSRSGRSRTASSSRRRTGSRRTRTWSRSTSRNPAPRSSRRPSMLALNNVEVIYDGVILVLKGVSVNVREGGITTILGANGAGKTTTLKAISGVLRSERGDVTKGSIELKGERIDRLLPHAIVRRGIVQVFEGRRVFEHLTAEENLIAGAHVQPDRKKVADG